MASNRNHNPGAGTADLVGRAREGDTTAFRLLFEQYKNPVYNFIYRMLGRRQDAEDVLQEVFVKIFQKLPTLHNPEAFSGWLFTTARDETINHLRRKKRHLFDSLDQLQPNARENTLSQAGGHSPSPEKHTALREREVAEILGCTVANVKLRVFRARAVLNKKLKPYLQATGT